MKAIIRVMLLIVLLSTCINSTAQEIEEPEFIGEVVLVKDDGPSQLLDKNYANFREGISWKHNSMNALSLNVDGSKAECRTKSGIIKLIVRAVDNNSDPMAVINIYRFKSKSKRRSVILSSDNSDQLLNPSKSFTNDLIKFQAKKYGERSYLLTVNLSGGEYGIIVNNPNNRDEKALIVSCIGIDNQPSIKKIKGPQGDSVYDY